MAIGDTVQAGLMRVDFSPFLEAGRANAAANASFGQALGQVAKGYIEGQEKKKRANEIAGFLMGQGVGEKDAQAIAKNPFLQKEYQRSEEAKAKMKMERERLATQANIAAQERAARQAELDQKYEREDADTQRLIGFSKDLISQTTDPAVVQNADMARPGLFALGGDPEMRKRFLDAEIERQPKVTVGSLGSEDFATVARETGMDPRLSANRFMGLQKIEEAEELANQPKAMSDKELEELLKLRLANQKALKESGLPVLTEGEQVIDELTAKEYSEYVNLGGKSAVQSKIKKLNKAIQDLEGSDDLNSWLTGVLPESMKALFNEKGLSVQQAVESVIQENLRETLGAQFAQKEGEMFMARGYDDRLSDEVNIERVKSLLKEIEDRASARTQTFDYFKKNKTMKGYDGPVFNESSQPSPSSSFDPQEIDRLYEEKMRLGKARGLR